MAHLERGKDLVESSYHPNVVAFYGVVPDGPGGTLATVDEFMVNGSLRHNLVRNNRTLDCRKKLMIAMEAAFGMEYLHFKNIVHFDLKCDNLLVNLKDPRRPICKVADFGLSRIKQNTFGSGRIQGTLPEGARALERGHREQHAEASDTRAMRSGVAGTDGGVMVGRSLELAVVHTDHHEAADHVEDAPDQAVLRQQAQVLMAIEFFSYFVSEAVGFDDSDIFNRFKIA
ncbi:hypothetical protein NL676_021122 [Syzygium grande]|nr:hypothetical protein NL676_021122 [Syzygium grande]